MKVSDVRKNLGVLCALCPEPAVKARWVGGRVVMYCVDHEAPVDHRYGPDRLVNAALELVTAGARRTTIVCIARSAVMAGEITHAGFDRVMSALDQWPCLSAKECRRRDVACGRHW